MIRSYLPFMLIVVSFQFALAQKPLNYCGTLSGRSEWLQKFQANGKPVEKDPEEILYVPISIHMLGTNSGAGPFSLDRLFNIICTLNSDFEAANIHFYLKGDVHYINRTSWYKHDSIRTGARMMFAGNIPNTINNYFVDDPAGNCGYNLPYAGIAVAYSCAKPTDHTWAHEVGHQLSLPHPFLGWEGGITHDNTQPPRFTNPAPEKVTYDYTEFKDSFLLFKDTLVIDTAWVERADGSNCRFAADGFCDTEPDYIAYRWNCDPDSISFVTQTDPAGVKFKSEGRWIMSYSADNCQKGFSSEQIAAMRANIREEKPWLLGQDAPLNAISVPEAPKSIYPKFGEIIPFDRAALSWEAVPNATHYLVQVSRFSSYSILSYSEVVAGTEIDLPELLNGRAYYWRIRPYNAFDFCQGWYDMGSFLAGVVTSVDRPENGAVFRVYPNVTKPGMEVSFTTEDEIYHSNTLIWWDMTGRKAAVTSLQPNSGILQVPDYLSSGMYRLQLMNGKKSSFSSILIAP